MARSYLESENKTFPDFRHMTNDTRDLAPIPLDAQVEPAPHLAQKLRGYVDAAKSPATLRAYTSAWTSFSTWCREHGLVPLPAAPSTVAAYVADRAGDLRPSTINKHLAAISQAHQFAGDPSPTLDVAVKTVVKGVRRTHGTAKVQKRPLLVGDLINIVHGLGDGLGDRRDACLLLLGFSGALRRSELAALQVGDLDWRDDGLVLHLRRSKTDQDATGRFVGIGFGSNGSCPVTATRRWLSAAGIKSGPVLRGVDRHGNISPRPMATDSICRTVKRLVQTVGHPPGPYGGHSLRSGYVTSAAGVMTEQEIAEVTGHKSVAILRSYVRRANVLAGDYVRRVGL